MDPLGRTLLHRRAPDRDRGLIERVKVHESVAARIADGTDRYAPLPLPKDIDIAPQLGGETETEAEAADVPTPLISEELRTRFECSERAGARVEAMEPVWRQVLLRRRIYFLSLSLTILLVAMPVWGDRLHPPLLEGGHGLLSRIIGLAAAVSPGFLASIIESWAAHPFFFVALVLLLMLSNGWANRVERRLRDRTRFIWNKVLDPKLDKAALRQVLGLPAEAPPSPKPGDPPPQPTGVQRLHRFWKWRLVPGLVAMLMLTAFIGLLLVAATRMSLGIAERGRLCTDAGEGRPAVRATVRFETKNLCNPTGMRVEEGERYVVVMQVTPWIDGEEPADPRGLSASDLGIAGYLGVPLRRVGAVGEPDRDGPMVSVTMPVTGRQPAADETPATSG